jgi:two-component system response regulator YesN
VCRLLLSELPRLGVTDGEIAEMMLEKSKSAKGLLLAGELSVGEVADAVGYESVFYFSRVFKRLEGISPSAFLPK